MRKGCFFGSHRVLEPQGALPQAAWRLDNQMELYDNEILLDVQALNIDSASFAQMKEEAGGSPEKIGEIILRTVNQRGKQHNPVTGSGGMLIGTVAKLGPALAGKTDLSQGDKIATLVSLTLTPLKIEQVHKVCLETERVEIVGQAVLFESGIFAKLPPDLPENLALAVLDVAGAPVQTGRLVKPGDVVAVLGGGGKSGLLSLYAAKQQAGPGGLVIGVGRSRESCRRMESLGAADRIVQADATRALDVWRVMREITGSAMADLVINCVNSPGSELASILSVREGGTVYFFSMATSFTAAALGAEGLGRDITMLIGNGYAKNHAELALDLLRQCPELRNMFTSIYA